MGSACILFAIVLILFVSRESEREREREVGRLKRRRECQESLYISYTPTLYAVL